MNIFGLEYDPDPRGFLLIPDAIESARSQCDKHVVKMICESGQMLSTAHRLLDGFGEMRLSKSGKTLTKYYVHPEIELELNLYKAVHHKHPCTIWTTESSANYEWHYRHFIALCEEYTYRYGKTHLTERRLREPLKNLPRNIPEGGLTPFRLAMGSNPECMFPDDPVKSYRMFYQTKQDRFKMTWTKRSVPQWFQTSSNQRSL